ncbi:ROK family transcriptional regulator [Umezawaea sp. NPDC059074]|uniref:ROK family transcriptional regulator n=1 Tax=Umezawaea sp. NPDC059074 TaxID=3346716 RepID=UPI0036B6C8AD
MRLGAVTGALVRETNVQAVYQALLSEHPVTRAELARHLGTTKPTTNRAIDSLIAAGLVEQVPRPDTAAGYDAVFFGPRMTAATVLALDLGSRYLRGTIAGLDGIQLARIDKPVADNEPALVLATAAQLGQELAEASGCAPELAVVGVGGVVDPGTGIVHSANQRALDGFAAAEDLGRVLGLPVLVENDINLAAIGEGRYGAGRGTADFAFLSIGSGVGAGLVIGGELHRGVHGVAGEIDHVPLGQRFRSDSPAADAFLAHIWQYSDFSTCEEVVRACREQDPIAVELIAWEAARIADCAMRITSVIDCALIVLGGGIGLNGDVLAEPVRTALASLTTRPPRISTSALREGAILAGGVAVALDTVLPRLVPSRIHPR